MAAVIPAVSMAYHHSLVQFDRDMQKLAAKFSKRGGFRKPLQQVVRKVMIPSIEENFLSSGRPTPWPEADVTDQYRQSKRGLWSKSSQAVDLPPLMVTQKMFRAATALARWRIADNRMHYGYFPATVWFAAIHDSEELSQRAGHPARPFALFQPEDEEAIQEIFLEWIEEKVNENIRLVYR